MEVVELASQVRPASGQDSAAIGVFLSGDAIVRIVAIDLDDAIIAIQMIGDTIAGATVLEAEGNHYWTGTAERSIIDGIGP